MVHPNPQRIAMVGPGSVGLFFAAHLAALGHDVIACARRPFDRYVIESGQSDEFSLDAPAQVLTDPTAVDGPRPWVFVAVKAHQTEGASAWLEALCDQNTRVVVVQNGIEHDRVAPFVNGADVVPAVVYCGAELQEPGRITHHSSAELTVPTEPHAQALVDLFDDSPATITPTDDFATPVWRKLCINVVANGLTALTGRDLSLFADETIVPTATALLSECYQVAAAYGAKVDPAMAPKIVAGMGARASGGTSMLYDTQAGRPTEHDAIHGAALRRAEAKGIDTPVLRAIHALLETRAP